MKWIRRWCTPVWSARLIATLGVVSVVSPLSPEMHDRVRLVTTLLPRAFPVAATAGTLALGALLVLLSWGLRRGERRSWWLASLGTATVVVLHLVKGLDVEEAALGLVLLGQLLLTRRHFTAHAHPRSTRRVLGLLAGGPVVGVVLGWAWLAADADGQAPGTVTPDRLREAALGLLELAAPVRFVHATDGRRAALALVVIGAVLLAALILAMSEPADGPTGASTDDRSRLQDLLSSWGAVDSLAYFSLRDDRSAIFSASGKAAVSYRVVGAVSLAAGDPLGDPEAWPGAITAWLADARDHGWTPAVLGASERGATAYHRAGLDALELGDEAVLDLRRFSLEGRAMRGVRQATARCTRAGLGVQCRRVGELSAAERSEIAGRAVAWRDGSTERGFSMALGRFADERDADGVVGLCRDQGGALRGVLHLGPGGPHGVSLDLMRRDPTAENGLVEHMVVALAAAAPAYGVVRVSLNFAVFRSVFARAERLGSGPVQRGWYAVLKSASRFWQLESLYRANEKYQPEWLPRFVCFRSFADLPRVGTAALRAEAFLP